MRLLLISVYPPHPSPEANHALHLSESLADTGVEVHVLSQKGSAPSLHSNIIMHPVMDRWSFGEIGKIKHVITRVHPEAIYLIYLGWIYEQSIMITVLPSISSRICPSIPFITQFEAIEGPNIDQPLYRALFRKSVAWACMGSFDAQFGTLLSKSDRIIALSDPHLQLLVEKNQGVANKSAIVPTPPLIRISKTSPIENRRTVRSKYGITETDFVFLYWGHIYPGKGLETLIVAFERVQREIPSAQLIVVGGVLRISKSSKASDEYYRMVRALPERLGIGSKVHWTGPFDWDSEAGSEYLYAGDACVLPFDWGVTLNNSTLAAAATHGLPMIATSLGSRRDAALRHGLNIYFCKPNDASALADAMARLILVPNFREKLRLGSISLATEWHKWSSVAGRIRNLIEVAKKDAKSPRAQAITRNLVQPVAVASPAVDLGFQSEPLVSVIVAAHNVETYLAQCLDSLVHQTLGEIEILAIDDASTDGSLDILRSYAADNPNIRVIALQENVGLASVRNVGLQYARGMYVTFLDGDDWADTRMCEILYNAAISSDADVVSGSATVFYDDDIKRFGRPFDEFNRSRLSALSKRYPFALSEDPDALLVEVVAWAKIYKRKFLMEEKIEFESGFNSYEDMCFHFKTFIKAKKIRIIDDKLVFYRQNRPGQISATTGPAKFQIFEIFQIIHRFLYEAGSSPQIWARAAQLEIKQFDWMLQNRVASSEIRIFMKRIAEALRAVPADAWAKVMFWNVNDAAKAVAMLRGWSTAFALANRPSPLFSRLLCMSSSEILSSENLFGVAETRGDAVRLPSVTETETHDRNTSIDRSYLKSIYLKPNRRAKTNFEVKVYNVRGREILISDVHKNTNVDDAIWRVEHDHLLTQACPFAENDIVIEVGAGIGVNAIHLAKKQPLITIYAIEPDSQKFTFLKQNIELNNVENVIPLNVAVGGANGVTTLFGGLEDRPWRTINPEFAIKLNAFKTQRVEEITVERIFEINNLRSCKMLMINAWGAVGKILGSFNANYHIDYLCGEVDIDDCNRATVEVASWQHSRQHFWRIWEDTIRGRVWSTSMQLPLAPAPSGSNIKGSNVRL